MRNKAGLETDCCTIPTERALLPSLLGTTTNPHRATVAERTSKVTGTHNPRRTLFASCALLSPPLHLRGSYGVNKSTAKGRPHGEFHRIRKPNDAKGSYAIHPCRLGGIHCKCLVKSTVINWWKSLRIYPFTATSHSEIHHKAQGNSP